MLKCVCFFSVLVVHLVPFQMGATPMDMDADLYGEWEVRDIADVMNCAISEEHIPYGDRLDAIGQLMEIAESELEDETQLAEIQEVIALGRSILVRDARADKPMRRLIAIEMFDEGGVQESTLFSIPNIYNILEELRTPGTIDGIRTIQIAMQQQGQGLESPLKPLEPGEEGVDVPLG